MSFEPKSLRPSTTEFQRLTKILATLNETGRALFISQQNNPADRLRLQALCPGAQQPAGESGAENRALPDGTGAAQISGGQSAPGELVSTGADPRVEHNLLRLEGLLK